MTAEPCARDDGQMADTTADRPDPRLTERDRPWMMRTYSGHSTAEASNALYRTNLAKGQTGLSIAFDLPTQCGYDPDDPRARGEVGKVGVPVAHLGHMRALLLRRGRTSGGGPTGGQADLYLRRLVVTSETGAGDRLDESLVKDLTGGDRIRARQPHGRNFEFTPTHHIWMATNHLPRITGTDTGIWRRIRLVPFTAAISDDRIDPHLGIKLRAELPGILNWAIQGCLDWQASGLGSAAVIDAATAAYRDDQDLLGVFLDERCTLDAASIVAAADLYADYRTWAETSGLQPLSKIALGRLLSQRAGIAATQSGPSRTRSWEGLRLNTAHAPF